MAFRSWRLAFSPRIVLHAPDRDLKTPCFVASVTWGINRWLGVTALYLSNPAHVTEDIPIFRREVRADRALYLGAGISSYPGLVTGGIAAVSVLLIRRAIALIIGPN